MQPRVGKRNLSSLSFHLFYIDNFSFFLSVCCSSLYCYLLFFFTFVSLYLRFFLSLYLCTFLLFFLSAVLNFLSIWFPFLSLYLRLLLYLSISFSFFIFYLVFFIIFLSAFKTFNLPPRTHCINRVAFGK
jgi:hypothetical protein